MGGIAAAPLLNVPQVAIGALGKIQRLPRYQGVDGSVALEACSVMTVSWAADHRVLDGAAVARFSNTWRRLVESPADMIAVMS